MVSPARIASDIAGITISNDGAYLASRIPDAGKTSGEIIGAIIGTSLCSSRSIEGDCGIGGGSIMTVDGNYSKLPAS